MDNEAKHDALSTQEETATVTKPADRATAIGDPTLANQRTQPPPQVLSARENDQEDDEFPALSPELVAYLQRHKLA